ncbi:hypothetical protein V1264_005052 [Littorina saxatilis]
MSLAYEIASRNGIQHIFNEDKKSAGKRWLKLFLQRHPQLSLRQPESTSIARAQGFNAVSVNRFYDLLEEQIQTKGFNGTTIYNVDETGVSTVQKRCQKILGQKGKHQIGAITSGERGTNTTVVCCVNGVGHYVPPLILFKRKRHCRELADGAPTGSLVTNNESGWMDKDMFLTWIRHFATHVKPSPDRPVLLIMDGHASHTRSLSVIDFARENGIVMLSLPPHATARLQPLDVAFFKPLQTFFIQEQETWMRTNPWRKITAFQIAGIFNKAHVRAASMATAAKGFETTGIWPCNRHVFGEVDFLPSIEDVDAFNISFGHPGPSSSPSNSCHTPFQQARPSPQPARPHPQPSGPPSEPTRPSSEPAGSPSEQAGPSSQPPRPSSEPAGSSSEEAGTPSEPPRPSAEPVEPPSEPIGPPSEEAGPPSEPARPLSGRTGHPVDPLSEPPSPCSEQDIGLFLALPNKTVIQTNPDGRCFFRSIVIGNTPAFQTAERDGNGLPSECHTKIQEQIQADALRQKMTSHMLSNIEGFREVSAAINFDMPSSFAFFSLEERILHMAHSTASVGDMDISATSEVLQQPIHIINAESGNVLKYNDDSLAQPVTLLYSPHGDNAGHYDCVLESAVSVALISQNPSVSQQKLAAKRKSRKTEAELITSSPYKRKLEEWQAKQKPTKKTSKSKPNTENTEKQKAKNKKTSKSKPNPNPNPNTEKQKARNKKTSVSHQQEASWFCFLCRECTCEDMIQCLMCSEWVHVDCAGTTESQREYFCDVCQSK